MKNKKHTKQQKKEVEQALEYLIAEGFVIKIGDTYRLKTQEELDKELSL